MTDRHGKWFSITVLKTTHTTTPDRLRVRSVLLQPAAQAKRQQQMSQHRHRRLTAPAALALAPAALVAPVGQAGSRQKRSRQRRNRQLRSQQMRLLVQREVRSRGSLWSTRNELIMEHAL